MYIIASCTPPEESDDIGYAGIAKYAEICIMQLRPRLAWIVGTSPPTPLPDHLLPLLEAIAKTGSLAHAATRCEMSYRAAWGLLRDCRELLGVDLVHLARGKGGRLAPAAEALVEAAAAGSRRLARIAPALTIDLAGALRGPRAGAAAFACASRRATISRSRRSVMRSRAVCSRWSSAS